MPPPWFMASLLVVATRSLGEDAPERDGLEPKVKARSLNSTISHLVWHPGTGLYVGAVNRLYHLNHDLELLEEVVTGPKLDSPMCHASGGCSSPNATRTLTDNFNKVLVADTDHLSLIVCGSLFQGSCEKYALGNLLESPPAPISRGIAANDEKSSTLAFIGSSRAHGGGSHVLYVGTTFTNLGSYRDEVPALSSRRLSDLQFVEYSFSKQSFLTIDVKHRDHFVVKYVYGFAHGPFAYFLAVQKHSHLPAHEEAGYLTRISRICANDSNYDTYVEVTLRCVSSADASADYSILRDAKVFKPGDDLARAMSAEKGDHLIVGAFSKAVNHTSDPALGSAICLFRMSDVHAVFEKNIRLCLNGTIPHRRLDYVSGSIQEGKCPSRTQTGEDSPPPPPSCDAALKLSGPLPIESGASLEHANGSVTAVAATSIHQHTVLLAGTGWGTLKKILLVSGSKAKEYEELEVDSGNGVLPDIHIDSNKTFVYVATSSKIVKVRMQTCDTYLTCRECVLCDDPHCGWCALEKRCATREGCVSSLANLFDRWVVLEEHCTALMEVLPNRAAVHRATEVSLRVRHLPTLPAGESYSCVFGAAGSATARVDAGGTVLRCRTPQVDALPRGSATIGGGSGHVVIPLFVESSETGVPFLSSNFTFYDCAAYSSCGSCIASSWGCRWCHDAMVCSHESDACRKWFSGTSTATEMVSGKEGQCPRLAETSELLIPSGFNSSIRLEVENLLLPWNLMRDLSCLVQLEGSRAELTAKVADGSSIECGRWQYALHDAKGKASGKIAILWNGKLYTDHIGFTIYRCEFLGSHNDKPDCLLCQTHSVQYGCRWCSQSCVYKQFCHAQNANTCPKPRIDVNVSLTSAYPARGPQSGGTQLHIKGANLNIGSELQVSVGKLPCLVNSVQRSSTVIICTTTRSPSPVQGCEIAVRIDQAYRVLTDVHFEYTEDPVIHQIEPLVSFNSGGRLIHVRGKSFASIQRPEMLLFHDGNEKPVGKMTCEVVGDLEMECISPPIGDLELTANGASRAEQQQQQQQRLGSTFLFGFSTSDGRAGNTIVTSYRIRYVEDPIVLRFSDPIKLYSGDSLVIEGDRLNAAAEDDDVSVTVGTSPCNVTFLTARRLLCVPPQHQPFPTDEDGRETAEALPLVVLKIGGTLKFPLGFLKYGDRPTEDGSVLTSVAIISGASLSLLLFLLSLSMYVCKSVRAKRDFKSIRSQMESLEQIVGMEYKQAFAELQAESADVPAIRVPEDLLRELPGYLANMLFSSARNAGPQDSSQQGHHATASATEGFHLSRFKELLRTKEFLMMMINVLEADESLQLQRKMNLASHLTICLTEDMDYFTEILEVVLAKLIGKSLCTRHPHVMLRRTEGVAEKMLANWVSILLYECLKGPSGTSLYVLCRSLHKQVGRGPVDCVTYEARYSLSEKRLLKTNVQSHPLKLTCRILKPHPNDSTGRQKQEHLLSEEFACEVLTCDSISQVKMKILDALSEGATASRNREFRGFQLVWIAPDGQRIVLKDVDDSSRSAHGWTRINTLEHCGIRQDTCVFLVWSPPESRNSPTKAPEVEFSESSGGRRLYHLSSPFDQERPFSCGSFRSAVPEVYLTKMLFTKAAVLKAFNDFFECILDPQEYSRALRWLFQMFDKACACLSPESREEVLHAWKSNSLFLRFWVAALKAPHLCLNTAPNHAVESSLCVVTEVLIDSCSFHPVVLSKDARFSRQLFAPETWRLREKIKSFYRHRSFQTPVGRDELSGCFPSARCLRPTDRLPSLQELHAYFLSHASEFGAFFSDRGFGPCHPGM